MFSLVPTRWWAKLVSCALLPRYELPHAVCVLVVLVCSTIATPSQASSNTPVTTSAIGVLEVGSLQTYCTGTLIAPDVVLTAAHCIVSSKAVVAPDAITFQLASLDERSKRRASQVVRIGGLVSQGKLSVLQVGQDWAVIKLDRPYSDAPHFSVSTRSLPDIQAALHAGGEIIVVGLQGSTRALRLQHNCEMLELASLAIPRSLEVTILSCVATPGDSGGPVLLRHSDGRYELLGVLSGFGKHRDSGTAFSIVANASNFAVKLSDVIAARPVAN